MKDFCIRRKVVTSSIKQKRWLITYKDGTKSKVSRDWSIIKQGTNTTRDFAAFLKVLVDNNAISIKSLELYYGVNGKTFQKQYKETLSDFHSWNKKSHCTSYLVYPKNIGYCLVIDEICFSNGELYTILTNKAKKGLKGAIIAIIKGTKSDFIIEQIKNHISKSLRNKKKEV